MYIGNTYYAAVTFSAARRLYFLSLAFRKTRAYIDNFFLDRFLQNNIIL